MLPSFWPPTFEAVRPYSAAASRGRISPGGLSSLEAPADRRWVLSSHSRLASCSDCLRQGPLAPRALPRFLATTDPSARLSPSPHFASSARAATLLPRAFSVGRGALPCFHPWPCSRAAALYPAGWSPQGRLQGEPAAFAVFESARHPELTSHEAFSGRSLVVAARALAHPANTGLCRWASPQGSPLSVPPKLCGSTFFRFGTFTLWRLEEITFPFQFLLQ